MITAVMLKSMWLGASESQGTSSEVVGGNEMFMSNVGNRTPFTEFVLSRLPDEESQKLFALSFGEYLRCDPEATEIDFDDVYKWLGMERKDNALRLLKREFSDGEYVFLRKEGNLGTTGGRPRDVYKISFNQFEELMIAAQTAEGKKARKLVLNLKKILQDYIIAEQTELKKIAIAEQERLKRVAVAEQARDKPRRRLAGPTLSSSSWRACAHSSSICMPSGSSATGSSAVSPKIWPSGRDSTRRHAPRATWCTLCRLLARRWRRCLKV